VVYSQPVEDEALLVARVAAGDGDALHEVLDRHGPLVLGLATRVTANAGLAEDVLQEVFGELWRRPERFDPERGSLRAFLAVQAHRRSVDLVRSTTRRATRELRHHVEDGAGQAPDLGASEPERAAERTALATRVREAVNQLPREQRIVVELAYFGGRTLRELAAELGIPEGTAKSRMRLAHNRLRPLLEGEFEVSL
jgi:RNA polymerase sigma factor (sigma-70 family)